MSSTVVAARHLTRKRTRDIQDGIAEDVEAEKQKTAKKRKSKAKPKAKNDTKDEKKASKKEAQLKADGEWDALLRENAANGGVSESDDDDEDDVKTRQDRHRAAGARWIDSALKSEDKQRCGVCGDSDCEIEHDDNEKKASMESLLDSAMDDVSFADATKCYTCHKPLTWRNTQTYSGQYFCGSFKCISAFRTTCASCDQIVVGVIHYSGRVEYECDKGHQWFTCLQHKWKNRLVSSQQQYRYCDCTALGAEPTIAEAIECAEAELDKKPPTHKARKLAAAIGMSYGELGRRVTQESRDRVIGDAVNRIIQEDEQAHDVIESAA